MPTRAQTLTEAARLTDAFAAAGAGRVETPILQPADLLLDLYGEDIRARAYVTSDALRVEQMLRPDFTVPVVHMHMRDGAAPARYTYSGEVFRRQEEDEDRANEYIQVGYELFDGRDPAAADAEVYALFARLLAPLGLRAATGDIGILMAAVRGLNTTATRKAALMRHIWRPRRFRTLLDRFAGQTAIVEARVDLLKHRAGEEVAPEIGLRHSADIAGRLAAIEAEAAEPPISKSEMAALDALLEVRETAPYAVAQLSDIAVDLPAIQPAVMQMRKRMDALAARGVDVDTLDFEASYGRTQMEYYDGFVFGFYSETRPDLPPVASGGRYDALTRELGRGQEIPAVGGVMRPGLILQLQEAAA